MGASTDMEENSVNEGDQRLDCTAVNEVQVALVPMLVDRILPQ